MTTKIREAAALLLYLGVVLVLPPIALIFAKPHHVAGIPLPALYIFGVWVALVIGALFTSRLLPKSSE